MSGPAVFTTTARSEAAHAIRWLARRNPQAARALRQTIADAATLVGQHPAAGRRQPDLVGPHYRLWSLVAFPYVLAYDPRPNPPQILRLAHTARDLGPLFAELTDTDAEPT